MTRRLFVAVVTAILIFEAGAVSPASSSARETAEPASEIPSLPSPQEPDAEADAGLPVGTELTERRTETTRTRVAADGDLTTEFYSYPIHYRPDADAGWEEIEFGFEAVPAAPRGDETFGPVAESTKAPVAIGVDDSAAATGFLTLEKDGHRIGLALPSADRANTDAVEAAYVGARADLPDLLPGVDFRIFAGATGAQTFLILDAPPAEASWSFVIDAPSLTPELAEDGGIDLRDAKGVVVARMPRPYMVDSTKDPDLGSGEFSDLVNYALNTDQAGVTTLTVTADPDWLKQATYPVFVDPSVTFYPGSGSYGDAFVSRHYPTQNFGDYVRPDLGYHELWLGQDPSNSNNYNHDYFKFDLSSIAGTTIDSADFRVYPYHQYQSPTTTWIGYVTSSWTESGITWNNQPGTVIGVTSVSTTADTYAHFNVTSTVRSWASGSLTNNGFRVHENNNNQTHWKRLLSSEHTSGDPALVVTYHQPSATVASPTASAWTKSRLMNWNFSDPSGHAQSHYEVQVDNNSDFSSLLSNSGQVASSTTEWSIPTGVSLANGTTYYWRVRVKDGTSWSPWTGSAAFRWDGTTPAALPTFTSATVGGAITSADPNYYDLGNGTVTIAIRGTDTNSGIKLSYLRLYNATNELRVYHDWSSANTTNCTEFDTSTLADATACSRTYNTGGTREVTFTVVGLNQDATFDIQYYFTDYAGNTVGYVDTGKNLILDATAPTGAITNPAAGATVGGSVIISGTATDANFKQYELHYGAGASPTTWTSIGTNPRTTAVTNGTLGTWSTTGLANGTYTIRLRVYDHARPTTGFTEVTRTVTLDSAVPTATISGPAQNAYLAGVVTVSGTASAPSGFASYSLDYGAGCSPTSWTAIGTNPRTTSVTNGTLGTWTTTGLNGQHAIRLVVTKTSGLTNTAIVCVNVDNTAPSAIVGSPLVNEFVNGTVEITGQAADPNFTGYDLHYGAGASPTTWTAIGTNPRTAPVDDGLLGAWNTAGLSGTYTIRLRVYDQTHTTSGFAEATRTVIVGDAVNLYAPSIVHATGAELRWSLYDGTAPSNGYEIHRSTAVGFTPGTSTLIARLGEPARTGWLDTSARPGVAFSYRVVANGLVSNEQRVTLPAAGQATVTLQPGPADGRATRIDSVSNGCLNYGAQGTSAIGSTASSVHRALFGFDLRAIPSGATISSATFSYTYLATSAGVGTVNLHQVLGAWREGSGTGQCDGSGATWKDTDAAAPWDTAGGDFATAVVASVNPASRGAGGTDSYGVTALVQRWLDGGSADHGFLVKLATEPATNGNLFSFATDDHSLDPAKRPRLVISYTEPGAAQPPHAAVNQPSAGATVRGTITVGATASDDSGVNAVEFLVDGAVVGSDATAPFALSWSSTGVANGSRALTVRATDNAGNVRTSDPITVTVDNVAPPTVSLTAPSAGSVSGSVTVSATAAGSGLQRVDFLYDDYLIGSDTGSPYSLSWNTLDPLLPAYDGSHSLVARAYAAGGQMTQSAAVAVTVANRGGARFAGFALTTDSEVPPFVFEDAGAGARTEALPSARALDGSPINSEPGTAARPTTCTPSGSLTSNLMPGTEVRVVVTNASTTQWPNGAYDLWYRWFTPDGQVIFEGRLAQGFQTTNAGASRTIAGDVLSPALCGADQLSQLRLRFDLFDPAAGVWFAEQGNAPIDHPVAVGKELQVAKTLSDALGLERYYQYWGTDVGAGMGQLVNLANGNSLLRWSPFSAPGRGLSTVVDLTYNSLEDHSESPVGNNWSLAVSSLSRLGGRLDIHPNKADQLATNANKWIAFTDGDGTTHRFDGKVATDGTIYWEEPPGVHLFLRDYALARSLTGTLATQRKWALTRPDGVTFYYNTDGFPTRVDDRNGNALTFTLEAIQPADDPGGNKFRVTAVTDAGGRSFSIDYFDRSEASKPQVRGKVQSITDHSGSVLAFEYYLDGNLRRIVQRGGVNADGSGLADRAFVFSYTTPNGSAPAIANQADRYAADQHTNQSARLYSVFDPLAAEGVAGHETTFSYFGPGAGELRWKLSGVTDRAGQQTAFAYDLINRVSTVTAPLSRVTRYAYDTDGKVTQITDPLNRPTSIDWTTDFHVSAVDEPGVGRTEYAYNANGYLTDRKVKTGVDGSGNPVFAHTRLTYQNLEADPQPAGFDESGKWRAGRTIPHLSQLATKVDPNGMLNGTPTGTHDWAFAYDTRGNLLTLTDPETNPTTFTYSAADGTLLTATDANGNRTDYQTYDPNGFPTIIREGIDGAAPALRSTRLAYDADGLLTAVQDPNHFAFGPNMTRDTGAVFEYDAFHRLGRQSAPKSTTLEPGQLIWSAALYDANDNLVRQVGPHFGTGYTGLGAATETTYDGMDRPLLVVGPDTAVDPAGERTAYTYDAAGRLTQVTAPKGVLTGSIADDFATLYSYDSLDRIVRLAQRDYVGSTLQRSLDTFACYDGNDDLVRVTAPNAGVSSVNCAVAAPSHTTTYEYDASHRQTAATDPEGHRTQMAYDPSGNVIESVDALGASTFASFDQRNMPIEVIQPFDTGHDIVTRIDYDPVGNRSRLISPRAVDADGGAGTYAEFTTGFEYDALNRLVRTNLPSSTNFPTPQYVHAAYDPNGSLAWSSLPTTDANPPPTEAGKEAAGTVVEYWDPGWIAASNSPDTTPTVHFDYTAEGWQAMRAPERASGELNLAEQMFWSYFADGMLRERRDRGGQRSTFAYDANNNLTYAVDAAGVTAATRTPIEILTDYTSLDQVAKTRQREVPAPGQPIASVDYTFTKSTYDRNGNVLTRLDNGTQPYGSPTESGGRTQQYVYDEANWVTTQFDRGADAGWADDQRITNSFTATGWEDLRVVERATSSTAWDTKQTTDWAYFGNGLLRQLTITDDAGATVERHTVGYLDEDSVYVNGNRTVDDQILVGPDTAAPCRTAPGCHQIFEYDPRDRLVAFDDGQPAGTDTTYLLDTVGNIASQTDTTGGVAATTSYDYLGGQLQTITPPAGGEQRYFYDPSGNVACVTLAAGAVGDCPVATGQTPSANVVAHYTYDYLDRLVSYRSLAPDGSGTVVDQADYEHDALDRVNNQTEAHDGGTSRLTQFDYQGLTRLVAGETQFDGTAPTPAQKLTAKSYAYDAWGHRISLTDDATDLGDTGTGDPAAKPYTYGYDVHGSVSLLLDQAGTATASYGYRPYGAADDALTAGDFDPSDPDEDATREDNPLNAFRYSGRRLDSGSGSIDMGARRYGPDTGRFLQRDFLSGALGDLGLAIDPLAQGRYNLAGGNPVSFMEWDGHIVLKDGGGGGGRAEELNGPLVIAGTATEITLTSRQVRQYGFDRGASHEAAIEGSLRERFNSEDYSVVRNRRALLNEAGQIVRIRAGRGGYVIPDYLVYNRVSGRLAYMVDARTGSEAYLSGPTQQKYFTYLDAAGRVPTKGSGTPPPEVEFYMRPSAAVPRAVSLRNQAGRLLTRLSLFSIVLGAIADEVGKDRLQSDVDWLRENDPVFYEQLPLYVRDPDQYQSCPDCIG